MAAAAAVADGAGRQRQRQTQRSGQMVQGARGGDLCRRIDMAVEAEVLELAPVVQERLQGHAVDGLPGISLEAVVAKVRLRMSRLA